MINKLTAAKRGFARALTNVSAGFTLVETLVAVLLLVVAIAGPLTIASRGATAARVAKDQIVAYYLAQDTIEYVRFKRDTACLTAGTSAPCPTATWLSGGPAPSLSPNCLNSSFCTIETIGTPAITACTHSSASTCDELYFNNTNKYYTHVPGSNTKTIFKRVVNITTPVASGGNADEALITVSVYWKNILNPTGTEKSITLTEEMFNWQ